MKIILGWILFVALLVTCIGTDYKEAYYDQIIDHFNFRSLGSQTYKQRYLYNDTWWEKERGPIFFYVGNEVPIDKKWNDDRFVMEIAPTHKAFVLFVEHRYRGTSLPFGDDSFEPSNIGWLSIEQALADYVFFLEDFKKKFNAQNCPVIGFGASYGAMLAAFMRFKYPNIIQGAVASSGPIFQLEGKTKSDLYFQAATETFRRQSADCEARVRAGYQEMNKWVSNGNLAQELSNNVQQAGKNSRGIWPDFPDIGDSSENKQRKGLKRISKAFRLCNRMKTDTDYDRFLRWTRNGLVDAAQKDHPFPTDTYPAFPVKVMCERLKEESSPVEGLRSAIDLFYNATGTVKCYDVERDFIYCGVSQGCAPGVISTAWDYQACTQNNLEGGSNGETDMFPVLPFTAAMRDEHCKQKWNVTPRRDWLETVYWGEDIGLSSNIVFSNGNLDPWAPGGVLKNVSDTVRAIIIDGAAHHLDFWASHPNDPQTVIDARNFEVTNIQKWIRDYHEAREQIQRK